MIFKIDENLPEEYAAILREAGFSADTLRDEGLAGSHDDVVFLTCQNEHRILVTLDLDFCNVRVYPPGTHHGIILIRSKMQDKGTLIRILQRAIPVLHACRPDGELWIVDREKIRFRSKA